MPIIGSSASQSGRTPGTPTSVSATAGDGQAVVSFTEPAYKGKGSITYTVTSSPGGFTASGASSPLTVTGLSNDTAYTFTVTASTAGVAGTASSSSASVTPALPSYALSQTFNASGNYTVPAGKTKVAVFAIHGGGHGNVGSQPVPYGSLDGSNPARGGQGGAGGAGGNLWTVTDYAVTAGANYTVTVGGAGGGDSNFHNVSYNSGYNQRTAGGNTGNGGNGGRDNSAAGNPGNAGGAGPNLSLTLTGLGTVTVQAGGGGGGGAGGGLGNGGIGPGSGGSGGSGAAAGPGGNGGNGGNGSQNNTGSNSGNTGNAGTQPGGGGGGGGGGGMQNNQASAPTSGGARGLGASGRVIVYVR